MSWMRSGNLIESVSEGFLTYFNILFYMVKTLNYVYLKGKKNLLALREQI